MLWARVRRLWGKLWACTGRPKMWQQRLLVRIVVVAVAVTVVWVAKWLLLGFVAAYALVSLLVGRAGIVGTIISTLLTVAAVVVLFFVGLSPLLGIGAVVAWAWALADHRQVAFVRPPASQPLPPPSGSPQ
jgi:hypothetical protein